MKNVHGRDTTKPRHFNIKVFWFDTDQSKTE